MLYITEKMVTKFLAHLESARQNSVQTRNYRLVAIRGLFNFIALQEPVLMEHCRRITAIPFKRQHEIPQRQRPYPSQCRPQATLSPLAPVRISTASPMSEMNTFPSP